MRVCVLGGSSPFTAGFFDALAAAPVRRLDTILLYGRNADAMRLLTDYAIARLPGVKTHWTRDIDAACDGFDVVVHQIRYGGLEGRALNEAAALAEGDIADETVGPAALRTALAMREPVLELAGKIARGSPKAHVVNLTNPLGLTMSLMGEGGLSNPIGVCELPAVTADAAARSVGLAPGNLAWSYSGLNHRGFLHHLTMDGVEMLPAIADACSGAPVFGGLDSQALLALGGLPTKYFCMFAKGKSLSAPGRAEVLMAARNAILAELAVDPAVSPPSLAGREQPWWRDAVIPLLAGLSGETECPMVLNLLRAGGLAEEGWCSVSREGVAWAGSCAPPPAIAHWVSRFRAHEAACLDAVLHPSRRSAETAQACDPSRLGLADSLGAYQRCE